MPQIIGPCSTCAAATFPQAIADLAASRTLVGYWRLGDPLGVFVESSGYNADGQGSADASLFTQATALTRHVAGALPVAQDDGAIQLNDATGTTSDYLKIPAKAGRYVLDGNMSVAAFVKPAGTIATFTGVAGSWHFLVTPSGWGIGTANGHNYFRRETASLDIARLSGSVLTTGSWAFVVGTYNTVDGHVLYLNGAVDVTDPQTFLGEALGATLPVIGNGLTFGFGAVDSQFYGSIDEVSFWADTLTASDITTLYAAAQ